MKACPQDVVVTPWEGQESDQCRHPAVAEGPPVGGTPGQRSCLGWLLAAGSGLRMESDRAVVDTLVILLK